MATATRRNIDRDPADWVTITRAPFLTAAAIPVFIGAAWSMFHHASAWNPWLALAALVGATALQVAANTFNDYYDWVSGTDPANDAYFEGLTGGSRAIERDIISQKGMFRTGVAAAALATVLGALLIWVRGWPILAFGAVGLGTAFFYTAPPLRLVARRGLGELFVGLNFGPLIVAGTAYTATGEFSGADLLAGIPIGLLTTAILWANEFPDAESDATTGKNHLVVTLGKSLARWGYVAVVTTAYLAVGAGVALGWFPLGALGFAAGLPFALYAMYGVVIHYDDPELEQACQATIQMHLVSGLGMTIGLWAFGYM
jgi:1,4-dihydroxy-2-naphthoate octaprenyltransferase